MKKILVLVCVTVLIGGLYAICLFNKKPLDTRTESPDYEVSASQLVAAFLDDEEKSTQKFADKILLISGKVTEVDPSSATIFLESDDPITGVACNIYTDDSIQFIKIKKGDWVRIKGKCTGKLTDVVINNGSIVSNQ
jgi:hypothetical protein